MKKLLLLFAVTTALHVVAQEYTTAPPAQKKIVPPTAEWKAKITKLAPERSTRTPCKQRKVLVLSLATGYQHLVIPHTAAVMKILGEKTGAYSVTESTDIEMLSPKNLAAFDAVVLNNTCPKSPARNLFLDVLSTTNMPKDKQQQHADMLEKSVLDFVHSGKGLIVLHGGITFQINSPEVSEMIGGSFNFHPRKQPVTLDLVDSDHPLLAGFHGKGFIHTDEPYLFKNAYAQKHFHPLLVMNVSKLDKKTRNDPKIAGEIRYVAWIKPYGKGRVFFCSPSHQPESFETAELLQFLLDGAQYALGDYPCDDSPLK